MLRQRLLTCVFTFFSIGACAGGQAELDSVLKQADRLDYSSLEAEWAKFDEFGVSERRKTQARIDFRAMARLSSEAYRGQHDISRILQQQIRQQKQVEARDSTYPHAHLYLFVSLSLPAASLSAYAQQMHGKPVIWVFRGLKDNDFKSMAEKLKSFSPVQGDQSWQAQIMIDSTLFERFQVDAVPAFILPLEAIPACEQQGCETPRHIKVSGEVPIAYALEYMVAQQPEENALFTKLMAAFDND